jgi:hypothetical protein
VNPKQLETRLKPDPGRTATDIDPIYFFPGPILGPEKKVTISDRKCFRQKSCDFFKMAAGVPFLF